MSSYDVVVVGGGPAGAVAARTAAENGASVLVVERRSRIEGPSPCTGLVSRHALTALGASERSVLRRIRAVAVYGPNAHATLRAASDKAVVVDRAALERELLERAAAAGVEVRLGTSAVGAKRGEVRVRRQGGVDVVGARVVVGADGPKSDTARWFDLPGPAETLRAAQVEVVAEGSEDAVDVFVGTLVAPGFFAWSVPSELGRRRVGLAVSDPLDPLELLGRLVARRFPAARVISSITAPIPIPPVEPIVGDGVLLVGDAAAQVKPWSGGGLYVGGICARLAGRAAADATRSDDASQGRLARYAEACRRAVGGELRFGGAARSMLRTMSDPALDAAISALQEADLAAFIAHEADIDHPSRILSRVVSHPRLWPSLFSLWTAVRSADTARLLSQTVDPV